MIGRNLLGHAHCVCLSQDATKPMKVLSSIAIQTTEKFLEWQGSGSEWNIETLPTNSFGFEWS